MFISEYIVLIWLIPIILLIILPLTLLVIRLILNGIQRFFDVLSEAVKSRVQRYAA